MRKGELIFNYAIVIMPLALGLVLAGFRGLYNRMPGSAFWSMAVFLLLGLALFLKAKLSVIRQGRLFTFGPSQMSKNNRMAYFIGYVGMGTGIFLLIVYSAVFR